MLARLSLALVPLLLLFAASDANADFSGYSDTLRVILTTKNFVIIHYHDWSDTTRASRWKMISTHNNPFTTANDYAFVECRERKSGKLIFKTPSPALKKLFLSPDEKYIVGISDIKLWNPYQFTVYSMDGKLIDKRAFGLGAKNDLKIPVSESVTNWVWWYHETDQAPRFNYVAGKLVAVSLRDLNGRRFAIPIRRL